MRSRERLFQYIAQLDAMIAAMDIHNYKSAVTWTETLHQAGFALREGRRLIWDEIKDIDTCDQANDMLNEDIVECYYCHEFYRADSDHPRTPHYKRGKDYEAREYPEQGEPRSV